MVTINPYLNFPGNTEEAFNFYRTVFGGEFIGLTRFKDTQEGSKLNKSEKEKLMHVSLPIGKGNTLMATDALESMGHKVTTGNNFSLSVETESKADRGRGSSGICRSGRRIGAWSHSSSTPHRWTTTSTGLSGTLSSSPGSWVSPR